MIVKIVRNLIENPFFIFVCGVGLTILPFFGIMYVHKIYDDGKNHLE